jgi:hypothetical protein
MSVFGRISKVVKSEWNHRFGESPDGGPVVEEPGDIVEATEGPRRREAPKSKSLAVPDVDAAMRVLELTGAPTLDVVRAQYRVLARRYHPRTQSEVPDQAHAAHVVMLSLTDALELLEEHLLPLPAPTARG